MSTLKVGAIRGVSASSDAITINNTDGTCSANITTNLSDRRININGAMTVSQRGTVTGITNGASKYGGADRLKNTVVNHGTYTASQEADAPSGTGFVYSHKITTTSAASSPASNARLYIQHKLEKQDLIRLKKGTSNAEQLTVQFYVKGDKTGTYILELFDNVTNRHVSATYAISSANTWEQKTITFPADTGGSAYDSSNGSNAGIEFNFWLAAGSAFTSGSLATTWTGNDDPQRVAGITVNVGDSGYWQITGLQIEIGSTASEFEFKPHFQELLRCQRYFQTIGVGFVAACRGASSSQLLYSYTPPVNLRASPTISTTNDGFNGNFGVRSYRDGSGTSDSTTTPATNSAYFTAINPTIHLTQQGFSVTDDRSATIFVNGGAITLSAEL